MWFIIGIFQFLVCINNNGIKIICVMYISKYLCSVYLIQTKINSIQYNMIMHMNNLFVQYFEIECSYLWTKYPIKSKGNANVIG